MADENLSAAAMLQIKRAVQAVMGAFARTKGCRVEDLPGPLLITIDQRLTALYQKAIEEGWAAGVTTGWHEGFTAGEKHAHDKPTIPASDPRRKDLIDNPPKVARGRSESGVIPSEAITSRRPR